MNLSLRLLALSAAVAGLASAASAQDQQPPEQVEAPPEEQEWYDDESVVVTGAMRVRQGGAQDVNHFRSVAAEGAMPRHESLTVEGLLGEHDLDLPPSRSCGQLLCLITEAMKASLPTRPDDRLFVGLGFASNIDAATWTREPLNLVAVVDKSGSMAGEPLELVRKSLRQIVGQMREGDQLSIVLYGDMSHLYLPPTGIGGSGRGKVLAAIDAIESNGSTNMEAGLKVGYATAYASRPDFRGSTRLMLFTDEQPNVGATDPESFIGMAEAASKQGIGLTTIGVGVQFDGELAAKVSSARGGNLFFISNEEEVKSVFEKQLDTMVSELAHDVRISMTPRPGYRLSGVFGVPDGLMTEGEGGTVTITVPTAFLSTNGGGIFASLAKSRDRENLPAARLSPGAPLMDVSLSFVGARDGAARSDRLAVANATAAPSAPLRLAHLLVDEYFALRGASLAFHREGKAKQAFALLSGIARRLDASGLPGLDAEKKLVRDMLEQAALYSGYAGETGKPIRRLSVVGDWEVKSVAGIDAVSRGDRLSFSTDQIMTLRPLVGGEEEEDTEDYDIDERRLQIPDWDAAFEYRTSGNRLTLKDSKSKAAITLERVPAEPEA